MLGSLCNRSYIVATGPFRSWILSCMGTALSLLKGLIQGHCAEGLVGCLITTQRQEDSTFVELMGPSWLWTISSICGEPPASMLKVSITFH